MFNPGPPQLKPCLVRKTGASAGWGERHTMDGHFRQQTDFCGGLGAALGGYQVVQQLELSTSRERVLNYVENERTHDTAAVPSEWRLFSTSS